MARHARGEHSSLPVIRESNAEDALPRAPLRATFSSENRDHQSLSANGCRGDLRASVSRPGSLHGGSGTPAPLTTFLATHFSLSCLFARSNQSGRRGGVHFAGAIHSSLYGNNWRCRALIRTARPRPPPRCGRAAAPHAATARRSGVPLHRRCARQSISPTNGRTLVCPHCGRTPQQRVQACSSRSCSAPARARTRVVTYRRHCLGKPVRALHEASQSEAAM